MLGRLFNLSISLYYTVKNYKREKKVEIIKNKDATEDEKLDALSDLEQ